MKKDKKTREKIQRLREYAQTRILYCPPCLEDGLVVRLHPCTKYEKDRYPELVFRCPNCQQAVMVEEAIGMDQLLQALLDTITLHKPPAEFMERLEARRYEIRYRREKS